MKKTPKQIDRKTLKTLHPLDRLNPLLLDELAAKSVVEELPADRIVCRHGKHDSRQIYLLSGQIEIATPGETKTRIVKSKSPLAEPLTEGKPHQVTIKTRNTCQFLYIDADLLELLMSDEPELSNTYEVTEITADDSDDWMLTFLQSPAFLQLPTENIQKLLTRMEEIPAKKDQVIIRQGDNDDNYYIIKSGSCNVHRQPYQGAANVLLAVLPAGSGFGEEALISNSRRNATITMRENGALMKLKKKDFLELLIEPVLNYIDHATSQQKLAQGVVVIDVRDENQSKQQPLDGAVNIPLSMLRLKFDSLKTEREYLLVCDDGTQSAAAAFLMIQNGFKCSILRDGLNSGKASATLNSENKATQKQTAASDVEARAAAAKKQTEQIAAQQAQIKAAREKAEQEIQRKKKELEASRARISQKNQQLSSLQEEAARLKEKAARELAKAKADNAANEAMQEKLRREAAAAEAARKKAEEEAERIKQQAIEEAERLQAEKVAQELARAEAERKELEQRQQEINAAMQQAETLLKQTAAEAEQARQQAEQQAQLARQQAEEEAERIKQQAMAEAEALRAEVEAERKRMQEEAERLKQEEQLIKTSALKIKHEADEIRRQAIEEAEQIRHEIAATREAMEQKLKDIQQQEQQQREAILAEAKKQADQFAASKTKQAAAEAEAIRQKAKEEAQRLHEELEQTRRKIEAEAAEVINQLKAQSEKAEQAIHENVQVIEEEVVVEVVNEAGQPAASNQQDQLSALKSVSIPGMAAIDTMDDDEAQRKAERIKAKLTESASDNVKVHTSKDKVILESDEDLFIFKTPADTPDIPAATEKPVIANRTRAEAVLTQIEITPQQETPQQRSVVIYPQQEQESAYQNNPFLKQTEQESTKPTATTSMPAFDKAAYLQNRQQKKSSPMAIAASFVLILAGAVFTLHVTDTMKVQAIAALFDSGNDKEKPAAITRVAKQRTIHKAKVLRADSNVNIKKKVDNKVDALMQGWKDILEEQKNPKKSRQANP